MSLSQSCVLSALPVLPVLPALPAPPAGSEPGRGLPRSISCRKTWWERQGHPQLSCGQMQSHHRWWGTGTKPQWHRKPGGDMKCRDCPNSQHSTHPKGPSTLPPAPLACPSPTMKALGQEMGWMPKSREPRGAQEELAEDIGGLWSTRRPSPRCVGSCLIKRKD